MDNNCSDRLSLSLDITEQMLKERLCDCFDIVYKTSTVNGTRIMFVMSDGMCDNLLVTQEIIAPILNCSCSCADANELIKYLSDNVVAGIDRSMSFRLDTVTESILSGLVAVFADGTDSGISETKHRKRAGRGR